MLIPFRCPHCGVSKQVMSEYAGQSGPCASCGRMITIPYSAVAAAPASTAAAAVPSAETGSRGAFIIVMILAGLGLIGILLFLGFIFFVLPRPIFDARAAAQQAQCHNNLKMITLALHNYHDEYKSFPPVYTTDADGNPLHSWRTLILPYLGHQQLYSQIALDEPWNSPRNRVLADFLPEFHCAADAGPPLGMTSYVGVTGPGTMWDPARPVRIADVTDGTANTIIVVEVKDAQIHWMEPRDLPLEAFVANGGQSNHVNLGRAPPKGTLPRIYQAAFADGSVTPQDVTEAPSARRAKATRNGGEVVKAR